MKYLQQIQKGIEYIELNLESDISVIDVANKAFMSKWHFQRTFKALTGETLKTYIRSRRLSISLLKLLEPNNKIIDIAFESGFESQESFTRAFKNSFDMTPGEFRSIGDKHKFIKKVKFDEQYLKHINQSMNLEPEIITLPKKTLVGFNSNYYGIDSDKNNVGEKLPKLWTDFMKNIESINNRIEKIGYGIIEEQDNIDGELTYLACVEISQIDNIPNGMICKELAEQKYAKFTHLGGLETLDNTVNYIYSTWFNNCNYEYANTVDIEIYNSQYNPEDPQSEVYYLVPISDK